MQRSETTPEEDSKRRPWSLCRLADLLQSIDQAHSGGKLPHAPLGHKLGRTTAGSFGGYQAIRFDPTNRVYFGASESRKDGHAAGY